MDETGYRMSEFLQQMVNGLTLGSVYALVALGYTLVYGLLELINFAHGAVVMWGGLVGLSLTKVFLGWGCSLPVALLLALVLALLVGVFLGLLLERVAYRPLRKAPKIAPLITGLGASMVLEQVAALIWGRGYLSFSLGDNLPSFHWDGVIVSAAQIGVLSIAFLVMWGLWWLVERTSLGRAMRAVAQDSSVAELMGVNINAVIAWTFAIGAFLGALAGFMIVGYYGIGHYTMGFMLGLKAFTAAVLGGIGHMRGAMVGGLLLGVIEALGAGYLGDWTHGYFGSNYKDVFAFMVLILVLVVHPQGLWGTLLREKV